MMRSFSSMVLFTSVLAFVGARADEPFLIELGDLSGGWNLTHVTGVSGNGLVAVGESTIGGLGDFQAFRWTEQTGMERIVPRVQSSDASAASADGSFICGHQLDFGNEQAFLWVEPDTVIPLGDLPGGDFYSAATGISGDGSVVVGPSKSQPGTANNLEAFRWTAETGMVGLGYLPGALYSLATAVSGDGRVVVGFSDSDLPHDESYYWTAEDGLVSLGRPTGGGGSTGSKPFAVSWDGSVIVGKMWGGGFPEAFRWTQEDGFVGLGDLPGSSDYSIAWAVNADGSVVGGTSSAYYNGLNLNYAFIWDEQHGMRAVHDVLADLGIDTTGLILEAVFGISADGRTIVIGGKNEAHDSVAWLAYLGNPCPGDFNKDGVVDEQDFTAFLNAFLAGRYSADFKTDAIINSQDFIAFLNAYVAGC
jgi:probable HAF family extracellular repeat protein